MARYGASHQRTASRCTSSTCPDVGCRVNSRARPDSGRQCCTSWGAKQELFDIDDIAGTRFCEIPLQRFYPAGNSDQPRTTPITRGAPAMMSTSCFSSNAPAPPRFAALLRGDADMLLLTTPPGAKCGQRGGAHHSNGAKKRVRAGKLLFIFCNNDFCAFLQAINRGDKQRLSVMTGYALTK